jgi:hypothetical protein
MIAEDEFGLLETPVKREPRTKDERLLAGFREVMEFVIEFDRQPALDATDIGETKLAMRLRAMIGNEEQRLRLKEFDTLGLLKEPEPPATLAEVVASDTSGLLDDSEGIFALKHVPKSQTMPEQIARRRPTADFEKFEPLFKQCHADLRSGARKLLQFRNPSEIEVGKMFVLNGVLLYVAEMGQRELDKIRKANARTRCIFENGTESDLLMQSLASNLYKDGRRVTEPNELTLERMGLAPDTKVTTRAAMALAPDTPMATVYVLRSLSDDPQVRALPHLHKIGSTKQNVEARTAGAHKQTTFLNAPVEVVAEYAVPAGIEQKFERLLHRIFSGVRLDVWYEQSGATVAEANEWFVVPLRAIDDAIRLIETEAIKDYEYDVDIQAMRLRS